MLQCMTYKYYVRQLKFMTLTIAIMPIVNTWMPHTECNCVSYDCSFCKFFCSSASTESCKVFRIDSWKTITQQHWPLCRQEQRDGSSIMTSCSNGAAGFTLLWWHVMQGRKIWRHTWDGVVFQHAKCSDRMDRNISENFLICSTRYEVLIDGTLQKPILFCQHSNKSLQRQKFALCLELHCTGNSN